MCLWAAGKKPTVYSLHFIQEVYDDVQIQTIIYESIAFGLSVMPLPLINFW